MNWLRTWWCRAFHREIMRPVHGRYRCRRCLRLWPVPWESNAGQERVPLATWKKESQDAV